MPGFFYAVRSSFALDPPLQSSRTWDALADSLCEGRRTFEDRPVAAFWSGSGDFAGAVPVEYEIAVSVFQAISRTVADPRCDSGHPSQVSVSIC